MGAAVTKVLVAVGCILGGLALSFFCPPIAIGIFSVHSMLIGAGISGALACLFNNDLSWGTFFKELFVGAAIYIISTGASAIASKLISKLGTLSTKLGKLLNYSETLIQSIFSSGSAIITRNLVENKPIFYQIRSAIFGSVLAYGFSITFEKLYLKAVGLYRKLWQTASKKLNESELLISFTKFFKQWRVIQKPLYGALEFAKNYTTSMCANFADKVIRNQKVTMTAKGALALLIVATGSTLESFSETFSRTGISYRKRNEEDQNLYKIAKQEFDIRNDDQQKIIDSLNDSKHLNELMVKPVEFEPSDFDLFDDDNDNPSSTNSSSNRNMNSNKSNKSNFPRGGDGDDGDDGGPGNGPGRLPTRQNRNVPINVSRAWNEGAKIYSTRDAIGTFRSQSEKYNYANVAHEFDNETSTNTTSPEYVYVNARSNSSQPVNSSSSSTNRSSQSFNMKEKSQATNDNSNVPQYIQSNQDSTNNNMTNKLNRPETINETSKYLPVKIHPVVCWNMDEQKYTFSNPNDWPAFPHKAKVVGFIGTKNSGRTTAIHSLLFELGYFLTEEQLAKSLLPVGVMMYVLREHDLIFLDCCDIADSVIANEDGNLLSGYLLEFFTYMASCHLVIHVAIPQKPESDDESMFSEQLINYIHEKAKLQLLWSSTIQTFGPSMLTVLVRGSEQQCEELDLTKTNLFSSRANDDEDDKIIFTQGFQDSKAFTWKYIPEEMISEPTLANGSSVIPTEIIKRLKDETDPHGLSIHMQAILSGVTNESGTNNERLKPFYNGIEANWQYLFTEIMSNSIISQSVTDVINYDTVQEADNQTGGLIQEYIDSVNKLVENSAGSALETNYKALCESISKRMDIETKKPDDEKDPVIGFKINIEIAKCLIESSKSENDLKIKENLISWGLHGLTLIHNRSPKVFEHTWMKLCIKTYNILDLLNTPVIYNVHWHCWNFLSFASSCGFKLELIEWQILERALYGLKISANKPQFHFHVLNCLLNFLETEPYLPVTVRPSADDKSNKTSSLQLSEEQYYRLKQMTYHGVTEYSKKCVREAAEQRKSTNMEKYLEEIKRIVNKQINILTGTIPLSSDTTSSPQNGSFSALHEHQQFAIISVALTRMNTDIALYVSKYIIGGVVNDDENKLIDLFSPNSPIEKLQDYPEMISKYRWLFLQRIASLQDDECTRNLLENTLSWVVNFLKKLPYDDASRESHSYAVLFANTLIVAESITQKRQRNARLKKGQASSSSRQPMTIKDINKKKEKIENEEEYGEVRVELLSQKCFKPVLQEFLRGLKYKDQKEYLGSGKVRRYARYIDSLLFAPNNSRIQALSLDLILIHERNTLRLMTFRIMDLCVKAFWKYRSEEEEFSVSNQMSIIYNTRSLLGLLNHIYWMIAKSDKHENNQGSSIVFGSSTSISPGQNTTIHSLPSSNEMHPSETLADEMIQRIGLDNWKNLITLTSIPRVLSDYISKADSDDSLNLREAAFDVRDEALILLWNLAECSGISLGVSKKVMTTNDFRSENVINGFSDTSSFDENGINRIKFLVNRVINQVSTAGEAQITTQELHNRFRAGKARAIELKRRAEISENIEKQMEEQKLMPNVQAMKEARLRRFGK